MLDRHDQQQLERYIEQRSNALHRTLSTLLVAAGAVTAAGFIHTLPAYVGACLAIVLCSSYSAYLLYDVVVFDKEARLLKQQARLNQREFTESMEAFLESVVNKN